MFVDLRNCHKGNKDRASVWPISWYSLTRQKWTNKKRKSSRKNLNIWIIMSMRRPYDNKTACKHTGRPPAHRIAPKHVFVPHHAHSFIIDVQPTFPTTAVFVWVKHVDRIVSAACGLPVVIKHPIQLVVHRLRRCPGNGCRDSEPQNHHRF